MSETKVILITILLMSAISYPLGYLASLYFTEGSQLAKVIHLSFVVLFFTSFYAVFKRNMMKYLNGKYDE
jgi:hypothetical protein